MKDDVLICGAGPAGALAAIVLARAGVRVRVLDRARFPRPKPCGDTVNPGARAILGRHGLDGTLDGSLPVDGMLVTAPGVAVEARYGGGAQGRALTRTAFDAAMLRAAADAGAQIEEGVLVRGPVVDVGCVRGLAAAGADGRSIRLTAAVCIAADGARSRLARALRLAHHPASPRRWAIGSHFEDVAGLTSLGEMHIRADRYVGVAPLPGGLANACVVTSDRALLRDPERLLADTVRGDAMLGDRFSRARTIARAYCLGPLAVDASACGMPGLLLAGDAAGFIDPMTGDGLRFALRGAELAAGEALHALAHGPSDAHERLRRARAREFAGKWRFNRTLRALVGSPSALVLAARGTVLSSGWLHHVVRYAGDLRAA
jgi:menaquinone-9 beta-reductase